MVVPGTSWPAGLGRWWGLTPRLYGPLVVCGFTRALLREARDVELVDRRRLDVERLAVVGQNESERGRARLGIAGPELHDGHVEVALHDPQVELPGSEGAACAVQDRVGDAGADDDPNVISLLAHYVFGPDELRLEPAVGRDLDETDHVGRDPRGVRRIGEARESIGSGRGRVLAVAGLADVRVVVGDDDLSGRAGEARQLALELGGFVGEGDVTGSVQPGQRHGHGRARRARG